MQEMLSWHKKGSLYEQHDSGMDLQDEVDSKCQKPEGCALCRYNPIKTLKTSFLGTMNMLGLAKRTRARFLLTSTSEVRRLEPCLAVQPCC